MPKRKAYDGEAAGTGPTVTARDPTGFEAWERRFWSEGFTVVAGTDEAGRGPLAGPVVAAAFAVLGSGDEEVFSLLSTITDSKQMAALQREEAFEQLTDSKFEGRTVWAIAEASVAEIDEMNILGASLCAMARAVRGLSVRPDCLLVDGCNRPPDLLAPGEQWTRGRKKAVEDEKQQPKLSKWFASKVAPKPATVVLNSPKEGTELWRPRHVEAVIGGDALVPSIAAASVLAKVHRDRLMEELHKQYPVYGFQSHKGYGTAGHIDAIKTHGVCPQHRRSFGPVREVLGLPDIKTLKRPSNGSIGLSGSNVEIDRIVDVDTDPADVPTAPMSVAEVTPRRSGEAMSDTLTPGVTPEKEKAHAGEPTDINEGETIVSSVTPCAPIVKRRLKTKSGGN